MKPIPLISCTLLMFASVAAAQAERKTPAQVPLPPTNPCQAKPENGAVDNGQGEGKEAGKSNLSQALEPCEGVLKPPPTGDRELSTPPPAKGNTPIIRPGEIPQQSKQD